MAKYYITTTAPYVNAEPHIGFALEIIQADVMARYHAARGDEVFFNTGTDEHGKKIYEKALENGKEPQAYCDEFAAKFDYLKQALNLSYNSFWRSTNPEHILAAQEIWRRVKAAGYIEKGIYKAKYCVGCELEKQDSDLENGKCPLHPNKEIELIEEENYFFKFSKIASQLIAHYDKYPDFVIPEHRQKEIRNFVEAGLADFSISRLAEKMPWGVPVPDDPSHVMYVWFDALTYYISALGWPNDEKKFGEYWGTPEMPRAIQVAGKDNLRQQTAMWQAMLLAAGLPPTRQIAIHGFITSGGQKMSKSLGNVINPLEYVVKYGTDALRYYLLAKMAPFEDGDFTKEKFEEVYQADLANNLGNTVSRIAALCASNEVGKVEEGGGDDLRRRLATGGYYDHLERYELNVAIEELWRELGDLEKTIKTDEVWTKPQELRVGMVVAYARRIRALAKELRIFLPGTAEIILTHFSKEKIEKIAPLFPRLL